MSRILTTVSLLILSAVTAAAEPTPILVTAGPPSGWIKEYDLDGNPMGDFIPARSLASPQYAALGPDNSLYVSSYTQSRVMRYDLDGNLLECDGPDGWRANSGTEIELLGAACDTIKTGDHTVSGSFPCGAVVEPPR